VKSLSTEPEFNPVADTPSIKPALNSTKDLPTSDSAAGHPLNLQEMLVRAVALLVAMGVTIVLFFYVDLEQIRHFQEYGYYGLFLTSLIGNATIALPIPSLFFTFVGGGTFNWVIVGLVSGIGEALGESTGYLAGFGGSTIIENRKIYGRMKHWMEKHGMLTVFVLSVVPNPLIDLGVS
jgi:uncharacterized membrane protein YdjX (TVP38/TMEM64 family)